MSLKNDSIECMQVSIVIPTYNGKSLLKKNLPQVIKAASGAEIVVVDDASTDGTAEFIKNKFPKVKLVQHTKNLRFAESCNSGVWAAKGEVVILLNSDVVPQKGFLKPLLKHFEDGGVFSVGCKEVAQENGKKVVSGRTEGKFARGFLVHWRPKNQESRETLWTFGGSMAVDKSKYLTIDGMDPLFAPAYWEDIDLCWRARQRGWKVIFEKDAVVYHNHETTNVNVFGKSKIEEIALRNQILFVWKNIRGMDLLRHFMWLPYHLIITSLRTKGMFIVSLIKALCRYI